ncbi:MAG: hypothetical protein WDW36_003921 [Sanguina aurantia]
MSSLLLQDFFGGAHKLPAFLAVNPAATVPAFRESPTSPVMTESGAVVQYILARYGKDSPLVPSPGTPEHALYLQWFWFAEATSMQAITQVAHHSMMLPEEKRVPWILESATKTVTMHLGSYEAHFASTGNKYLIGDQLTAADIMNVMGLYLCVNFIKLLDASKFPKLSAYYELLTTHEGFKRAYDVPL